MAFGVACARFCTLTERHPQQAVCLLAGWADSLGMLHNRYGNVADALCATAGPPSLVPLDATLVELCDGTARPGAAHIERCRSRRWKERTHPEFVGPRTRSRFVVLAGEVGGTWSGETFTFVRLMAKAKARSEPSILRTRVELACRLRCQQFLHVRLVVLSQVLCWDFADVAAWTVTSRSLLMLSASGAMSVDIGGNFNLFVDGCPTLSLSKEKSTLGQSLNFRRVGGPKVGAEGWEAKGWEVRNFEFLPFPKLRVLASLGSFCPNHSSLPPP